MNDIKEFAIYPGQIKINNEVFFGIDYKITDLYNELAEENKRLKNQLQQKENIIKEVRDQLDYLETYSSREDVFEDIKRRLDRIESIIDKGE